MASAISTARMRRLVFEALRTNGVETLTVDYGGYIEDGKISHVEVLVTTEDGVIGHVEVQGAIGEDELDRIRIMVEPDLAADTGEAPATADGDTPTVALRDVVEAFCLTTLRERHGGWMNGDGGFGSFTFIVGPTPDLDRCHLEHSVRVTGVETTEAAV